jgi:hypothetical protein
MAYIQNSAIRRRRLVRRFRDAGATDPGHAVTLESLGERRSWVFDKMAGGGVFLPTENGRFYLDERTAAEYLSQCRSRGWLITAILVFVLLLLWLFGHSGK